MSKLIVIGQQQRCGGSLLNRMFDGHPKIAVHPQENYCGRPYKYFLPSIDSGDSPDNVWKNILEPPMRLVSQFKRSRGYPVKYDIHMHKQLFLDNFPSKDSSYSSIYLVYLDSLFKSISEYSHPEDPEYYLYFTPRQALYAEEIISRFQGSHVVQLLRHPLGFYNSVKSHNRFYDIYSTKFIWRLFFFNGLYLQKKGVRGFHLIFFEDLLEQPEKKLKDLCRNLNLDYENNLLTPTSGGLEWYGNSHFRKLKSIDKSVTDHFKKYLSQDEIAFFRKESELFESLRDRVSSHQDIKDWASEEITQGLEAFEAYLPVYKRDKPINTKAYVSHPEAQELYASLLGTDGQCPVMDFFLITDIDEKKTLLDSFETIGREDSNNIPLFSLHEKAVKSLDEESSTQLFLGILNVYGPKTARLFLSHYLDPKKFAKTKDNAIQLFWRDPRGMSLKSLAFLARMALRSRDSKKIKSMVLVAKLSLIWLKNRRIRFLLRRTSHTV